MHIAEWKKKLHTVWFQLGVLHMHILKKRTTLKTVKRWVIPRSWWGWGRRGERAEHREFGGQWKYSIWYIIMNTWLYTFLPTQSNVNYGLCVVMMWQCRFINSNQGTTLVEEIDNVEAMHVWGLGYMGYLCTYSQLYYRSKFVLNNCV